MKRYTLPKGTNVSCEFYDTGLKQYVSIQTRLDSIWSVDEVSWKQYCTSYSIDGFDAFNSGRVIRYDIINQTLFQKPKYAKYAIIPHLNPNIVGIYSLFQDWIVED